MKRRGQLSVAGLLFVGGCFAPPSYLGRSCELDSDCPGELRCAEKACVLYRGTEEAGSQADAGVPPLPSGGIASPSTQFDGGVSPAPSVTDAGTGTGTGSGLGSTPSPTPGSCSPQSTTPTSFTVNNRCTFPLDVIWLDRACAEKPTTSAAPGESVLIDTYLTHEFMFRNLNNGEMVARSAPVQADGALTVCKGLVHRYSFNGDASESVNGANGALRGGSRIEGGTVFFNGIDGHVELPIGPVLGILQSATIEAWFGYVGENQWTRVFDFGAGTNGYMMFTPRSGFDTARFVVRPLNGQEYWLDVDGYLRTDTQIHVAVTIDKLANKTLLYLNGELINTGFFAFGPSEIGNSVRNWIGRSQYPADPHLFGGVDELRIYQDALSPEEIAQSYSLGFDALPQLR